MKKFFWLGLIGLLVFEVSNVYFIMPMPGSQEMNSIDVAYFLYTMAMGIPDLVWDNDHCRIISDPDGRR